LPTISMRLDGCFIIRGKLHTEDEDFCTWQVVETYKTLMFLETEGRVNLQGLLIEPVEFPFPLLKKLKSFGWILTEKQKANRPKQNWVERVLVSALAKELGLSSDHIIKEVRKLGVQLNKPSDNMSKVVAFKILDELRPSYTPKKKNEVVTRALEKEQRTEKGKRHSFKKKRKAKKKRRRLA